MQPTQASVYAALATRAAALSAQLGHPAAVLIDGHPRAEFDGVYRIESEHKGKPVLYNRLDTFLYHFESKDAWRIGGKHRPDEDKCVSHIAAGLEGSLPTGAQTWLTHSTDAKAAPSAEHKEAVFTVTLLVPEPRSFSPEALDLTGLRRAGDRGGR